MLIIPFRIVRAARRAVRFGGDERGVTMVEFGILALPFFALVAATMETGLTFLASNVFESALHDSVRLIRTGQVQNIDGYGAENFRAEICEHTYGFFDCGKIMVRVGTVDNFADAHIAFPVDPDTAQWTMVEAYDPGKRKQIVVAEAYYKWNTIFNFFGFDLATLSDGTRLMGSAEVWRNEPF